MGGLISLVQRQASLLSEPPCRSFGSMSKNWWPRGCRVRPAQGRHHSPDANTTTAPGLACYRLADWQHRGE